VPTIAVAPPGPIDTPPTLSSEGPPKLLRHGAIDAPFDSAGSADAEDLVEAAALEVSFFFPVSAEERAAVLPDEDSLPHPRIARVSESVVT